MTVLFYATKFGVVFFTQQSLTRTETQELESQGPSQQMGWLLLSSSARACVCSKSSVDQGLTKLFFVSASRCFGNPCSYEKCTDSFPKIGKRNEVTTKFKQEGKQSELRELFKTVNCIFFKPFLNAADICQPYTCCLVNIHFCLSSQLKWAVYVYFELNVKQRKGHFS